MKLEKVRMYQVNEGWSTLCCETKSSGRTCKVCGEIPVEKIYFPREDLGFKDFSYEETPEKIELKWMFSPISSCNTCVDWTWEDHYMSMHLNRETGILSFPVQDPLGGSQVFSYKQDSSLIQSLRELIQNVRGKLFIGFMERCFEERGIQYLKLDDLLDQGEKGWVQIGQLCATPNLQNIPLPFVPELTEEEEGEIQGIVKGKDILKKVIGHKMPVIIQWCETPEHFILAKTWGGYFKKPDNLMRVLNLGNTKNPYNTDTKRLRRFHRGMKLLQPYHKEETVLANRILSAVSKTRTVNVVMGFIADMAHMFENIQQVESSYVLPFKGNIKECHDTLSKDFRRLVKKPCVTYHYHQQTNWEKEVRDYTFHLAKNSVELAAVGSEMNICVGSYSDAVEKGESTIVWMRQSEEEKTDVCLQVSQQMIVQAKIKHNGLPNEQQCRAIRHWANECNLRIHTNDIGFEEKQEA